MTKLVNGSQAAAFRWIFQSGSSHKSDLFSCIAEGVQAPQNPATPYSSILQVLAAAGTEAAEAAEAAATTEITTEITTEAKATEAAAEAAATTTEAAEVATEATATEATATEAVAPKPDVAAILQQLPAQLAAVAAEAQEIFTQQHPTAFI